MSGGHGGGGGETRGDRWDRTRVTSTDAEGRTRETTIRHDEGGYGGGGGHGEAKPRRAGLFTWVAAGAALIAGIAAVDHLGKQIGNRATVEAAGDASRGEAPDAEGEAANADTETQEVVHQEETHEIGFSNERLTTVHVDLPTGSGFRALLLVRGEPFGEHLRMCDDERSCAILEEAEEDLGGVNVIGGIISAGTVSGEDDGINFPIPRAITIDGESHEVRGGNAWLRIIPDDGSAERTIPIPANPPEQIGDPEE